MPLPIARKREIVQTNARTPNDSGSPEVQVALLSARIDQLTQHLGMHKKDHHTRVGLLRLVGKRRRLLDYLHSRDVDRYKGLIERARYPEVKAAVVLPRSPSNSCGAGPGRPFG